MNQSFIRDLSECLDWIENGITMTPQERQERERLFAQSQSAAEQMKQYRELKKRHEREMRKMVSREGDSAMFSKVDERHRKVQCVVVISEKDSFMVGADIYGLYQITDKKLAQQLAREGQKILQRLSTIKLPTIAAVNGSALGGGCELAMACNYRWCINDSKVELGLPETQLGVLPGAGGTVRLPRLIGLEESLKIVLAGGSLRPEKAHRLGLVDELIDGKDRFENDHRFFNTMRTKIIRMVDNGPFPKPHEHTATWLESFWIGRYMMKRTARQNLDKLTRGNYPAQYAALESLIQGFKMDINDALKFEAEKFGEMASTQVSKNLMSIFFLRETAKKMSAHVPPGVRATSVKQLSVIGAGVMGSGIAQLLANKKFPVYMKDIKQDFVDKGLKQIKTHFNKKVEKKRLSPQAAQEKINLVKGGVEYTPIQNCQVIIEAAVENMKLKKAILQDCEKNTSEDTIFSTNTSTLSITELATVSKRPDKVVGFHFFNPVAVLPLVEIIRGEKTSDETVATMYQLALSLGKTPIIVNDGPGFLVNRILGIFLLEAMRMIQEKYNIEQIDKALKDFGLPMGAIRLMDEVGLDVASHSGDTLEVLGERFKKDAKGKENMKKMLDSGALGKKTGKGFFIYDENGKEKGLNPKLKKLAGYDHSRAKNVKPKTVVNRCVLLMINEAAYILDAKIAKDPETVDTGMIFGTGFAPFRGGLLSYADTVGAPQVVRRLEKLQKKYGDRFKPAPLLVKMAKNGEKFFPKRVVVGNQSKKPQSKL